MAIQEWSDLAQRKEVPLERALAAYDMFILRDREGDFDEVCKSGHLTQLGVDIASRYLHAWTISQRRSEMSTPSCWSKAHVKKPSVLPLI